MRKILFAFAIAFSFALAVAPSQSHAQTIIGPTQLPTPNSALGTNDVVVGYHVGQGTVQFSLAQFISALTLGPMLNSPQLAPSTSGGNACSLSNICLMSLPVGTRSINFFLNASAVTPDELEFVIWGPNDGTFPSAVTNSTPQVIGPFYGQNLSNASQAIYNIPVDTTLGYQIGVLLNVAASGGGISGARFVPAP